ncbi:prepilin-type N-terminal cleavage/methylation domain-containing protein [Motilimonas sp. E26]|uniref:PilW family protein n=1 Tax=Motilimonas TaxID=1914248 RepID=UPI001E352028|nr:prepilin-type N-terminal cleavage/methylation domain-containing protein [Motilimonas sp. E26]MCE0558822.1 prepilin-type N-terminal cleavage/methylation domain-containing protein [Motilimonas sp. E26]
MKKMTSTSGFTLIELLIAMLLGLVLVLACSSVYGSLKNTLNTAKQLSEAQESLRGAFNLISRSVRQGDSIGISTLNSQGELLVTYQDINTGDQVLSCLGNTRSNGNSDRFYSDGKGLYCDDGIGNQLIALNVEKFQLQAIGTEGVNVSIKVTGMPTNMGTNGLTFTVALRQKILARITAP